MIITLFGYRITIFKLERIERFTVSIDHEATRKEADAIKSSEYFQNLRKQAAQVRAERG